MGEIIKFPTSDDCYFCEVPLDGAENGTEWTWANHSDFNVGVAVCWACITLSKEIGVHLTPIAKEKKPK